MIEKIAYISTRRESLGLGISMVSIPLAVDRNVNWWQLMLCSLDGENNKQSVTLQRVSSEENSWELYMSTRHTGALVEHCACR